MADNLNFQFDVFDAHASPPKEGSNSVDNFADYENTHYWVNQITMWAVIHSIEIFTTHL